MYPPPPPPGQVPFGQLQVDLGFFPLMWMLYLVSPSISINGNVQMVKWGTHVWTLPAGMYDVEAWYAWLWNSSPGRLLVQVFPGQVTRLRYRPSWLRFLPGKMTLVGPVGMLPPGAGY